MNNDLIILISTLFGLIMGLTLHEFAHGLAAHYLGDTTAQDQGRLTLNPLAHISLLTTLLLPIFLAIAHLPVFAAAKPVPFNPWAVRGGRWGAAIVAAAGPLTNLFIAVVCAVTLRLFGSQSLIDYEVLGSIVQVNANLFVFNLIPVPPLDGSRVLYAMVTSEIRDLMDRLERGGLAVIFGLVLILSYTPLGNLLYGLMQWVSMLLLPVSLP